MKLFLEMKPAVLVAEKFLTLVVLDGTLSTDQNLAAGLGFQTADGDSTRANNATDEVVTFNLRNEDLGTLKQ